MRSAILRIDIEDAMARCMNHAVLMISGFLCAALLMVKLKQGTIVALKLTHCRFQPHLDWKKAPRRHIKGLG